MTDKDIGQGIMSVLVLTDVHMTSLEKLLVQDIREKVPNVSVPRWQSVVGETSEYYSEPEWIRKQLKSSRTFEYQEWACKQSDLIVALGGASPRMAVLLGMAHAMGKPIITQDPPHEDEYDVYDFVGAKRMDVREIIPHIQAHYAAWAAAGPCEDAQESAS